MSCAWAYLYLAECFRKISGFRMRDIVAKIMVNMNPEYFMYYASKTGNLGMVKYLWKNHRPFGHYEMYEPLYRRVVRYHKEDFLHFCAMYAATDGHLSVLEYFDKKNIKILDFYISDVLEKNNDAITEFIMEKYNIKSYDRFINIVGTGNVKMVKLFLDKNPDFLKITANEIEAGDESPVYIAAESGNLEMVKLIIEYGGDIHIFDDICMIGAVSGGNMEILDYLYNLGCSPNGANGSCPEECVFFNNLEALKWFYDKGVDIWSRSPNRWFGCDGAGLLNAACYDKKKFLKWFKEILGGK